MQKGEKDGKKCVGGEGELRGGCRRPSRAVRLEEVLVCRPAGKWKKKGACRLPEASLGPSVLSFRRQVLH